MLSGGFGPTLSNSGRKLKMIGKLLVRRWKERSAALRYGVPVVAVAVATLITTSSSVIFGQTPPFLLAILVSGLFGGRGPALLAAILSIPSAATMVFVYPSHLSAGFTVAALVIGWFSGLQYESTESLRKISNELREKVDELERSNAALQAEMASREQAEVKLRQCHTELARMNRVMTISTLVASIAHEITQPIATARNNARAAMGFLDRNPPDLGEVREALACIVDDADRVGDIIDGIRDHFKKAPPRKDRFDLNEAINEVIALAGSAITTNGVSVRIRLAEVLPPVQGDRVQLQQVMLNLILNAVEAMSTVEAGPRELLISTEQTQTGGALVAVRDSGPGIDPDHLDRVFQAFYTTKSNGVGMGLAISHSIIQSHGGQLSAHGNAPRGAIFKFELPVRQPPAHAA
jgi:C4-dicarboxylate-specific signal transduction histidine kinase